MVQSGQLSELTDSGSRVFEEQPLLEESFTIHLGAPCDPIVFRGCVVSCSSEISLTRSAAEDHAQPATSAGGRAGLL